MRTDYFPCRDSACNAFRETKMVTIEAGGKPVWCDPCIAPIVGALNAAGIRTVASCCGHRQRPGNIVLADGRELIIARNYDEARAAERAFPKDINGALHPYQEGRE